MRLKVPPKIPKNALVGSSSSPNFLFFFKKNGVQPDLVLFLRPGGSAFFMVPAPIAVVNMDSEAQKI